MKNYTLGIFSALLIAALMLCQPVSARSFKSYSKQKLPGKVVMLDGKVYTGTVRVPAIASKMASVTEDGQKKPILLPAEEVDYVEMYNPKAGPLASYKIVRTKVFEFGKLRKNYIWLIEAGEWTHIKLFRNAHFYQFNDNGSFTLIMESNNNLPPSFFYMAMRPGEPYVTTIAMDQRGFIGGTHSYFKRYGAEYFADCPELVQKVQDKDFKASNIREVLAFYNEWKENLLNPKKPAEAVKPAQPAKPAAKPAKPATAKPAVKK